MTPATSICPICSELAYAYFAYPDFFGKSVNVCKCLNCGHGFHQERYTPEQFTDMYQAQYAQEYLVDGNVQFVQRQAQYQQDVNWLLAGETRRSLRVLDFGCSSGLYLQAMPDTWNKSGFEINPVHLQHIRQTLPHITSYDDPEAITAQFDVITLRGVIEHIPDHSDLLRLLDRCLAPGGKLHISATPDFSSVCASLYKGLWNQAMCPEHIHQFTSASLSLLLAKSNLVLQRLAYPYLETPYAQWASDSHGFLAAAQHLTSERLNKDQTRHAFCGNMMSALFETIQFSSS